MFIASGNSQVARQMIKLEDDSKALLMVARDQQAPSSLSPQGAEAEAEDPEPLMATVSLTDPTAKVRPQDVPGYFRVRSTSSPPPPPSSPSALPLSHTLKRCSMHTASLSLCLRPCTLSRTPHALYRTPLHKA